MLMLGKLDESVRMWLCDAFDAKYPHDKDAWEASHMYHNDDTAVTRSWTSFPGYASADNPSKFTLDGSDPQRDGSDIDFHGRESTYMHFQSNRDFIKAFRPPVELRIFLRALRHVNEPMLAAVATAALETDTDMGRALADAILEGGSVFGAVSVHHTPRGSPGLDQAANDEHRRSNWHVDEATSLVHGSITLKGTRTLGIKSTPVGVRLAADTHVEVHLEPGDVYIGNAAAYEHAVYDRGGEELSLQCRVGYRFSPHAAAAWQRVGFNIWDNDSDDHKVQKAKVDAAIVSAMRGFELRVPKMADLAMVAACEGDEGWAVHGWFYHHCPEAMRSLGWEGAVGVPPLVAPGA